MANIPEPVESALWTAVGVAVGAVAGVGVIFGVGVIMDWWLI